MKYKIFILFIGIVFKGFILQAQEQEASLITVKALFSKANSIYKDTPAYSMDITYKMYGTYTDVRTTESYSGTIVKNNKGSLTRIKNTSFIIDKSSNSALRLYEDQKLMEISSLGENDIFSLSPIKIDKFLNQFANNRVTDKGDTWLCTLTTAKITQVPYGKIEIYISKADYTIQKQTLYFLSMHTYVNEKGEQKQGNPKMEILTSNFKKTISSSLAAQINISRYISKNNNMLVPSNIYKDYKIIQN